MATDTGVNVESNDDVINDSFEDFDSIEAQINKSAPVQTDVRRKIEDILEAKRLRAEFDF